MKNILLNYLLVITCILFTATNINAQKKESAKEDKKKNTSNVEIFRAPPPDGGGGDTYTWNRDYDGDGYGDPNLQIEYPTQPNGYVANKSDCNDYNSNVHPGALEICDGIDNDSKGSA